MVIIPVSVFVLAPDRFVIESFIESCKYHFLCLPYVGFEEMRHEKFNEDEMIEISCLF
jgi:hypothetical protein